VELLSYKTPGFFRFFIPQGRRGLRWHFPRKRARCVNEFEKLRHTEREGIAADRRAGFSPSTSRQATHEATAPPLDGLVSKFLLLRGIGDGAAAKTYLKSADPCHGPVPTLAIHRRERAGMKLECVTPGSRAAIP
jgi:hypothetical protein